MDLYWLYKLSAKCGLFWRLGDGLFVSYRNFKNYDFFNNEAYNTSWSNFSLCHIVDMFNISTPLKKKPIPWRPQKNT